MSNKPAVLATNLSCHFGELVAVDSLNLEISEGTIYGFLGPNGSGKTTTIRMLTGLLPATRGEVCLFGKHLTPSSTRLRQIGYMTQKFSLYSDLTVRENLQFMADIYNIPARQQSTRIQSLLSRYGLESKANQLASSMSGGQKQRLALAAATIHEPRLLFLDEPTSAVDPENRRDFWEKLFDLCDQGTTILVSTHYMDEAERCHQLAILERGIKRADGAPDHLMESMQAHVIEIQGHNLRQLKKSLQPLDEVVSVAQIGATLRVLINKDSSAVAHDPIHYLQTVNDMSAYKMELARPNLEDVFVTCTGARS
jgi:ABC-2 type transport system ATP-binding protein